MRVNKFTAVYLGPSLIVLYAYSNHVVRPWISTRSTEKMHTSAKARQNSNSRKLFSATIINDSYLEEFRAEVFPSFGVVLCRRQSELIRCSCWRSIVELSWCCFTPRTDSSNRRRRMMYGRMRLARKRVRNSMTLINPRMWYVVRACWATTPQVISSRFSTPLINRSVKLSWQRTGVNVLWLTRDLRSRR